MPGGDGTGPMGRGAVTRWGRGPRGGFGNSGFGRGRQGGGNGDGRGRRNRFWATGRPGWMDDTWAQPASTDTRAAAGTETQVLERRAAALENEQQQIKSRLAELKRESAD